MPSLFSWGGDEMENAVKAFFIIVVCGVIGMILAYIEQIMFENEYVLHLYLDSAAELPGLQIVSIIIWLLFGCVLAAMVAR